MKTLSLLSLIFCATIMSGCSVRYALNDTSIPPDAQTASVLLFRIEAPLAKPAYSQSFTEAMKDIIQSQSRLTLVPSNGDVQFEGSIVNYHVTPAAVEGGNTSQTALNRLTVTVRVRFINTKNEAQNFESNFSKYSDFSGSQNLAAVENQLLADITQQLVQDIFNKAFSQW